MSNRSSAGVIDVNQSNFIHPTNRGGMRELFIQVTAVLVSKFWNASRKKIITKKIANQEKHGVLSQLFFFDPFSPRSCTRALSVLDFQRDFIFLLFAFLFLFSQGCSSLAIYLSLLRAVLHKEELGKNRKCMETILKSLSRTVLSRLTLLLLFRSIESIPRARWLNTVSSTCIWMGRYNHSLSLDATIMVSKNCSITGEYIVIIFFDVLGYHSNSMTS